MIVQRLESRLHGVINLDELAHHCRVPNETEFLVELQRFADAAVREAEDMGQLALLFQAVRVTLDAWPKGKTFRLPIGPLLDADGLSVTGAGESFDGFTIFTGEKPSLRLTGAAPRGPVEIEYIAGYAEAPDELPADLRQALMDQAACYFDARGAVDQKTAATSPHFARIIGRKRGVRL